MLQKISILALLFFIYLPDNQAQTVDTNLMKAFVEYDAGNAELAIQYIKKANIAELKNSSLYIKLGTIYYQVGKYEQAIELYKKAEKQKRNCATFELAKAYAKINDNKLSISYLQKYLKSKYHLSEPSIVAFDAFIELQKTENWKRLFEKNKMQPTDLQLVDARYAIKYENYDEAYDLLEEILYQHPKNKKTLELFAQLSKLQKDYKIAISYYDALLKLQKNNADYLNQRGQLFLQVHKYKKASKDFAQAIKINPYKLKNYLQLSECQLNRKKYTEALSSISFYLKYQTQDAEASYLCGLIHSKSGDKINALRYFNRAVELEPATAKFLVARAATHAEAENYQYAYSDYSKALDFNPKLSEVYFNRAKASLQLGNTKAACYDWIRAKRLNHLDAEYYIKIYCK